MTPPATGGLVTCAHTRRAALDARGPVDTSGAPMVEQLAAPPSACNATEQPAGRTGGTTPAAEVAANVAVRLKESLTAPVFVIPTWKRVAGGVAAAGATPAGRMKAPAPTPGPSPPPAGPPGGGAGPVVGSAVLVGSAHSAAGDSW